MFSSGAWEPATSDRWVSRAHLQPKAGQPGKFRVCLDLRHFNSFLRKQPCRCENLRRLSSMIRKGDYMFSFDLQDGFHALAVAPEFRKYLTFQLEGVGYIQLAVLPFGLASSPFAFGKLMRVFTQGLRAPLANARPPPTAITSSEHLHHHPPLPRPAYVPPHLRRQHEQQQQQQQQLQTSATIIDLLPRFSAIMHRGLRVIPYVDDFLILCNPDSTEEEKAYVASLLSLLGLQRNPKKGIWEATQTLEHLGIGVDSDRGIFFVTPRRLQLLSSGSRQILCTAARNRALVPRKQLAAFAGLAQSLYLAIPGARHWLRSTHDCIAEGGLDWTRRVRLSEAARRDLQFFVDLQPRFSQRAIRRSPHRAVLHSDASETGWGATLNCHLPALGFWLPHQRRHHITLLEAKAVRFAIEAFAPRLRFRHVLLHEDNQAVVAMLTSWSSRSPALLRELRKIWWLLDQHDITLDPRWISTHDNFLADGLSRFRRGVGWRLHPELAQFLLHQWQQSSCTIDRFAEASFHLLPCYNALCLDPSSAGLDAFAQEDWSTHYNFCNPDFGDLPRLAHLLQTTPAATAIVIAPYWPAQAWFQTLSELASSSLLLPPHLVELIRPDATSPPSGRTVPSSWQAIAFAIPAARSS